MIVYLNAFGMIAEKEDSIYTAVLSGSYRYSILNLGYFYKIKSIVPNLAIEEVFSKYLLEESSASHP